MKRNNSNDDDMPVGVLKRITDFLPAPEDLIIPEKTVKVTIVLDEGSVQFFKRQAKKHGTKYQKMIRKVLDKYAQTYEKRVT